MTEHHPIIIVGSGPAGYAAAVYTARAGLKPVVFAGALSAGGALMTTTDVENFPGFPEGILGPDLMDNMQKQAELFGADVRYSDVVSMDLSGDVKTVTTDDDETFTADAVILALGSEYRKLGAPGEEDYSGRGVSYCATCDGFFFRDQPIIVVGGGDSAMEEALFLARFGSSVTIIHRRDEFRASKIMLDRARANEKISFVTNAVVTEVLGEPSGKMTGVRLRDTVTGEERELEGSGLFVAIGHIPRSGVLNGQVDVDEDGYIKVDFPSTRTSVEGVFAAGDVVDRHYRQAITAAGTGAAAALDAERYLSERE